MENNKSEIFSWIITIILAVGLALLIRAFVFEPVKVEQTSMYPTLNDGDRLISSKISYETGDPQFQDIIVIQINKTTKYVKRVIGLPGDSVEIKNSKVYVNGEEINEPYISRDLVYDDYNKITVPDNYYFVLGDNRPYSKDSRDESVGLIPREKIISKIAFRIYPFNKIGNPNK